MKLTAQQALDIASARYVMQLHAPRGAILSLTDLQRAIVLIEWLDEHVGLSGNQMIALGDRIARHGWEKRRTGS